MIAKRPAALVVLLFASLALPALSEDIPGNSNPASPKLDSFGDPLPAGAYARFGTIRFRHDAKAVAFLDKNTIVSIGSSFRFWDAATGRLIREHRHEKMASLRFAAISANGQRAVTLNNDAAMRVWEVASGNLVYEADPEALIKPSVCGLLEPAISVSADGNCFVAGVWEMCKGDNYSTQVIPVWKADSNAPPILLQTGDCGVQAYSISPNGQRVVTALRLAKEKDWSKPSLVVWDSANGKKLRVDDPGLGTIRTIEFSPSGGELAVEGDKGVALRTIDGKEIWRHSAESDFDNLICVTRDHVVVRVDKSATKSELRFLDPASGKVAKNRYSRERMRYGEGTCLDGERIIVAGNNCLHSIRLTDGIEVEFGPGHTGGIRQMTVSPDGRCVVSGSGYDNDLIIWDVASGRVIRRLEGRRFGRANIDFSPNGKLVASTSYDQTVRVWEVDTGRQSGQLGFANDWVSQLQFLSDNSRLAIAWRRQDVTIHQLPSIKEVRALSMREPDYCWKLIRTPDGQLLAIYPSGNPRFDDATPAGGFDVCDALSERLIRHFQVRCSHYLRCHLSPDGRTLASHDMDGLIHLWELTTGQQRLALKEREPHQIPGDAQSIAFSPDCLTIASVNQDQRAVRLWDLPSGQPFASIRGHNDLIESVEFTPDGRRLLTGSDDTTILGWDLTRPEWRSRTVRSDLSDNDLATNWEQLRHGTAEEAYRSEWALVGDPKKTVEFLRTRLPATLPIPAEKIDSWIADLDAKQYSVRDRAQGQLQAHFDQAEVPLRKALANSNSAEAHSRITRIIDASFAAIPAPDRLRDLRAVEVLERIGTNEARDLLRKLTASEVLTAISRDAAQSLKRLEMRPR